MHPLYSICKQVHLKLNQERTIYHPQGFSLDWGYYLGAWLGTWGKLPNPTLELGPLWQVWSAPPKVLCHLRRMQRQSRNPSPKLVLKKRRPSPTTTKKWGQRSASFPGKLLRFDVCKPIFSPLRCFLVNIFIQLILWVLLEKKTNRYNVEQIDL